MYEELKLLSGVGGGVVGERGGGNKNRRYC